MYSDIIYIVIHDAWFMIIIEDYALRYIGDNHHPLWEIFSNKPSTVQLLVGGLEHLLFFQNIWDNPSLWLSYVSRWLKPPTSNELIPIHSLISDIWAMTQTLIDNLTINWCMSLKQFRFQEESDQQVQLWKLGMILGSKIADSFRDSPSSWIYRYGRILETVMNS
jgi:hypothetical protein